jgi:hypothetical protein
MAAISAAEMRRRRDDLVRRLGRADDVASVFSEASIGLQRLVPFDDVNRYVDLARADRPVAAFRAVTGDPRHSSRYRTFLRPIGFGDELRAVLRVGDSPWGTTALIRRHGRPPFTADDIDVVASLIDPIGDAIRTRAPPGGVAHRARPS